jgi:hypothetical protein
MSGKHLTSLKLPVSSFLLKFSILAVQFLPLAGEIIHNFASGVLNNVRISPLTKFWNFFILFASLGIRLSNIGIAHWVLQNPLLILGNVFHPLVLDVAPYL